ncbi:hypothetical protein Lalb_Chr19g0129231 [Lupinus albus]|uniref:Uncharacterized protein n=1 Tax=Lupinus albus TaxID=3870 RepID=A0A6A4NSP1_LUPAL|nr:hypothetical protein Lalb_Chr19g0129231 [Lupinus albus]
MHLLHSDIVHQLKKAPLVPKPLLQKRRSFKRQPSRLCRGNQASTWEGSLFVYFFHKIESGLLLLECCNSLF